MLLLQVILVFCIFWSVYGECYRISLWDETSDPNHPSCGGGTVYVRGLIVGTTNITNVTYVHEAVCCDQHEVWKNSETLVEYTNWANGTSKEIWYSCPRGYYLNGFYLPDSMEKENWILNTMSNGRCVKPAAHPTKYGHCYTHGVGVTLNDSDICFRNSFVVGLRQSYNMFILFFMRCCYMELLPHEMRTVDDLKTRIMSTGLSSMARLAQALGYSNCVGRSGVSPGEDFTRVNDTWKANVEDDQKCGSGHCNNGLKIVYDNWRLAVKNITYGEYVVYPVPSETIHSGTVYNEANSSVTESFQVSQTFVEKITHSFTNTFTSESGLELLLSLELPSFHNSPVKHTIRLDLSKSTTNHTETLNVRTFKKDTQINLSPISAANCNVKVSKVKTRIPYSADVVLTFTAQFEGVLKGDDPIDLIGSNRHHLHQGTEKYFTYSFGDETVPFHKALRSKFESRSDPWLWDEILWVDKMKVFKKLIDDLTEERTSDFKISGILEYDSDTEMEVFWKAVQLDL